MKTTMLKTDLQAKLQVARKAAQSAGHIIMAHYGKTQDIRTKSSEVDLVTAVDLESDQCIREILHDAFPEDILVTEETFQEGQTMDLSHAWIVDPLDGTTNYAHGFPHFAVSIAYVENNRPMAGVIFDPFKNELFIATCANDEAHSLGEVLKNGRPIQVSPATSLTTCLLATGFPYNLQSQDNNQNNINLYGQFLKQTHGIRRAGAAALDLAYVACGRLDGFWELRLSPWDVAAGMLMIECAGGTISGFNGEPLNLNQRYIDIVGSNGKLHANMIDVISGFTG